MKSFKVKLAQVCFVVCLSVSLAGFAFAADINLESSRWGENRGGAWVLEDGNNTAIWSQAIAAGCHAPEAQTCNTSGLTSVS